MPPRKPASLRHRRVVARLKALREAAGMSMADASLACDWDNTKVSKIEGFKQSVSGDDVFELCKVYGVNAEETNALAALARESKKRGWWHVYSTDILGQTADLVELEADARQISAFTIDLLPGLLQTEDYCRALIRAALPAVAPDETDARVRLRMDRQERTRDARIWAVVGEAALRAPVGGHQVMAEQLRRLLKLAEESKVTLQVMPDDAGAHASMGVPFTLLELTDGAVFGYQDGLLGGVYLEAPDTDRYREVWAALLASALRFDHSIATVRRHLSHHEEQVK